ncbi:MAG: hypothetical protein AB1813_16530 [Verrucomicrobiota bacterium]
MNASDQFVDLDQAAFVIGLLRSKGTTLFIPCAAQNVIVPELAARGIAARKPANSMTTAQS